MAIVVLAAVVAVSVFVSQSRRSSTGPLNSAWQIFWAQRRLNSEIRRYRSPGAPPTLLGPYLSMSPTGFEHAIAHILSLHGYSGVQVSGGAGDLSADITALDPTGLSTIVQCKRYGPQHKVGSPPMQQFIGMAVTHHKAGQMIYVTTSEFTAPARQLASQHGVRLVDGTELVQLARSAADKLSHAEAAAHQGFRARQAAIDRARAARRQRSSSAAHRPTAQAAAASSNPPGNSSNSTYTTPTPPRPAGGGGASYGPTQPQPRNTSPGWYRDPWGIGLRWWDGERWTHNFRAQ